MPQRFFEKGNFYHLYNRGVEKRDIFMDKEDHKVFMHHLFSLNSFKQINNLSRDRKQYRKSEQALVRIHGFCLMKNHYHLLLEEIVEGGISKYMQKVGTGYVMYFNKKYDRSGGLFQGAYKLKHIGNDSHFNYILNYIHLNPHDQGQTLIMDKLLEYKYSSLPAYLNEDSEFRKYINTDYFIDYFGGVDAYKKSLIESAQYQSANLKKNGEILIDALE